METGKGNIMVLPEERIMSSIYLIRGMKVMIDRDLAELYGVETRVLNQSVRRNLIRFPEDFMFQMNDKEFSNWKSQIVISKKERMGLRKPPLVFTEQGVAMLSSILNSEIAILVNIQIIRVFTRMRTILSTYKEILKRLEQLEKKGIERDKRIIMVFDYIKKIESAKKQDSRHRERGIGFRIPNKE